MRFVRMDPEKGYISNMLWVPKKHFNVEGMKRALEFEISERDNMTILRLWEEAEHHLIVPRAMWSPSDLPFECVDVRPRTYVKTKVRSRIKLDHRPNPTTKKLEPTGENTQRDAIAALLASNGGTLQLGCGKGKTPTALELAARLQVPTLIIVDNTHLFEQWKEAIANFLDVPGGVGFIKGDVRQWKKSIVLATYQTLANWAATMPEEVRRWFGLIVWDEGHHMNAPTFSRSAPLFYGMRISLTATPERPDGKHVICEHHVGGVIFKDVTQRKPPKVCFRWTGFELDPNDASVQESVLDRNSELHFGRLANYFGSRRDRLVNIVLDEVQKRVNEGHKVLVLSSSVAEVFNLTAIWATGDPNCALFTDIPYPTSTDVGEIEPPAQLDARRIKQLTTAIADIKKNLALNAGINPAKRVSFEERVKEYELALKRHEVWKKTEKEYKKRQNQYVKDLMSKNTSACPFTRRINATERMRLLRKYQVIFAIKKYGREGLDDDKLSAVIVSTPFSERGILQQVMGRPRDKDNSVLVFLEDNVGPLIGQCQKLRKLLRYWPLEEGGPFKYENIDHPSLGRRQAWNQQTRALRTLGSSCTPQPVST